MSSGDTVIRVAGLGKRFRLGRAQPYRVLAEDLTRALSAPLRLSRFLLGRRRPVAGGDDQIWALKDISLEVRRGEVVGVIGRNGAGKSTLLKILSRITAPSEGRAEIRGRMGSLLEVGTGFHPELTGRENIYLNGAILGMKRAEISAKFDRIVAFSEVEKFIDTPVKHYSSGMYLRLAFSVAAHLEPDILLVDEVLAVGDAAFQRKCLGKMGDVARAGRTVLFVSHNMAAVSGLCGRCILLEGGKVAIDGAPEQAIKEYLRSSEGQSGLPLDQRTDRRGDGRVLLTQVTLLDQDLEPVPMARCGAETVVALDYQSRDGRPVTGVFFEIGIYTLLGQLVFLCGTDFTGDHLQEMPASGRLLCRIPELPLAPGFYELNIYCGNPGKAADWITNAARLQVVEGNFFGTGRLPPDRAGMVMVRHTWELDRETQPAPQGATHAS